MPRVAGDVHTHVWAPEHVGAEFRADLQRVWGSEAEVDAGFEAHEAHAAGAGRSVVLAFDAEYAGLVVPDEFVARYVGRDPERLVGFCSIDPRRPDAADRLSRAVEELGLRGVKLAPTYQGFDPPCRRRRSASTSSSPSGVFPSCGTRARPSCARRSSPMRCRVRSTRWRFASRSCGS